MKTSPSMDDVTARRAIDELPRRYLEALLTRSRAGTRVSLDEYAAAKLAAIDAPEEAPKEAPKPRLALVRGDGNVRFL